MDTIIRKLCAKGTELDTEEESAIYAEAAYILNAGGLVAFPTETVYGLGGDALLSSASQKIYEAKGRPSDNPLIVHIAEIPAVETLAANVSPEAKLLMKRFWPGPMTLIFKKKDIVPMETTGGLDTVAIRFPSHPVAQRLIRESGLYIAAPSANASGRPSPTTAQHVMEDLSGRVDMILDAGPVELGLESTIIDVTGDVPVILRPGYITQEMLSELFSEVQVDPAVTKTSATDNVVAKAPGMKYRHYAPEGQLYLVEGETSRVIAKINALVKECERKGERVAVIATDETKEQYEASHVMSVGSRADMETVAHSLFSTLREMDTEHIDVIYCESFARTDLGQAIMNRLLKAAGYHVLSADKAE